MTIINTYGISAGREIPREINDESDKHRREAKRRADAAYLSDKERARGASIGRPLYRLNARTASRYRVPSICSEIPDAVPRRR
jgi:hypothetical protein